MFGNLFNKKIKAIVNENILFAFRENLLLVPILTYILMLGFYFLFGDGSIISDFKRAAYISLSSGMQYFLGVMIIIFLSISSYDKDFKSKNIYIILQQVSKQEYFLGKVFSIFLLSGLLNIIFMIIFYIGYIIQFREIDYNLIYIFLFQQLEFMVITFIASLISLMLNKNILRIIVIIMFIVFAHAIPFFRELVLQEVINLNSTQESLLNIFYYIFPNLEMLNVKNVILFDLDLNKRLFFGTLYSFILVTILYYISIYIFRKKDF